MGTRAGRDRQETALRIFQGLSGSYDGVADLAMLLQDRRWKRWAEERIPFGRGGMVLDVGCGTLLLEERLPGVGRVVGVDLTREMLREGAAKRLPNVGLLVNGDAETLPFSGGTFDAVVSCYVAKYVDIGRLSKELARVSKEGATVILYDFAKPRGAFAPLLNMYISGGLRAVGAVLGLAGRREAATFSELPGIVERTRWDTRVVDAMEAESFETVSTARLTGGVVFAYHGRKRGTTYTGEGPG